MWYTHHRKSKPVDIQRKLPLPMYIGKRGIYETILKELQSAGSSGEFYTPRAVTDFMAK